MSKKSLLLIGTIVALATLFVAGGLIASTNNFPDVIKMKSPEYDEHRKGIVEFTHEKHVDEYNATCGECHHDDEGKPLTELKKGDCVQRCIECHDKPSEKPKGRDAPKLTREEELEYHAEALHDQCRGCHREYNKEHKTRAAPTTCSKCHPREEK